MSRCRDDDRVYLIKQGPQKGLVKFQEPFLAHDIAGYSLWRLWYSAVAVVQGGISEAVSMLDGK